MLKTRAGPGRRRCPARARSRRDEATRRTVDGSEETVGRRRFFCVCVRGVVLRRDGRSFATRDLRSFVRVARARALVRDALRASRRLADADARREVTEEIARYARDFPGPIAEASEEEGARALAEAKRRVRELARDDRHGGVSDDGARARRGANSHVGRTFTLARDAVRVVDSAVDGAGVTLAAARCDPDAPRRGGCGRFSEWATRSAAFARSVGGAALTPFESESDTFRDTVALALCLLNERFGGESSYGVGASLV